MTAQQIKYIAGLAGPVGGMVICLLMLNAGFAWSPAVTAGVTFLCAVWWIFEPIPIPATSLLPIALFPLLGVLTNVQVAQAYGDKLILLLLGGMLLSTAMERSGAHRRVALTLVHMIGQGSHRRVVWGFMAASALLSMWISNTATTLMLLPVALAVLQHSDEPRLKIPLLLGICYAASVGGIGTPIGTPPNVVFMKIYTENTGVEFSFLEWMTWGIPVVILMLPLIGWWLTRDLEGKADVNIPALGGWQAAEKRVLIVFALTALMWMTRKAPFGGWSEWFGLPGASDATVALMAAVLLFVLPDGRGERLLNWETANKIPWGMLLLFAAGITIAKAFVSSGLSAAIADQLEVVSTWHVFVMLLVICLCVTFMTEMTSNLATTTLLMPILAALGLAAGVDPALMMLPAAISASCAFMLPVATAPNAIIFGTGQVSVRDMAKRGLALNLMGALVVSTVCWLILS